MRRACKSNEYQCILRTVTSTSNDHRTTDKDRTLTGSHPGCLRCGPDRRCIGACWSRSSPRKCRYSALQATTRSAKRAYMVQRHSDSPQRWPASQIADTEKLSAGERSLSSKARTMKTGREQAGHCSPTETPCSATAAAGPIGGIEIVWTSAERSPGTCS